MKNNGRRVTNRKKAFVNISKINQAKEKLHNTIKDLYTAIELKKATARLRKSINAAKRNKWNEFINEIDPSMSHQFVKC